MLSKEEVQHIAMLARIGLSDEETGKYQHDLSTVLDFFKELQELDTAGEIEVGVPEKENDTREDTHTDFGTNGKQAILDNIPETKDGYIKVRSVF